MAKTCEYQTLTVFDARCSNCDTAIYGKTHYTDEVIRNILLNGVADSDIRRKALSAEGMQAKAVTEVITFIENPHTRCKDCWMKKRFPRGSNQRHINRTSRLYRTNIDHKQGRQIFPRPTKIPLSTHLQQKQVATTHAFCVVNGFYSLSFEVCRLSTS